MLEQDWLAQGQALSAIHNQNQWDIGDWLLAGDSVFESPGAALDAAQLVFPQFARHTLTVYKRVANTYPLAAREQYPKLSFSHFAIVADLQLPPTQASKPNSDTVLSNLQAGWLQRAQEHGLTCAALRFAIANPEQSATAAQPAAGNPPTDEPPVDLPKAKSPKAASGYSIPGLRPAACEKITALAKARNVTPAALVVHAVEEFLAANVDAVGDAVVVQQAEQNSINAALDAYHAQKDAEIKAGQIRLAARRQAKTDFAAALHAALPGDECYAKRKEIFDQASDWVAANINADPETVRATLMALVPAPLAVAQEDETYAYA